MAVIKREPKKAPAPAPQPAPVIGTKAEHPERHASRPIQDRVVPAKKPFIMVDAKDNIAVVLGRGKKFVEYLELMANAKPIPGFTTDLAERFDREWKLPPKSYNPNGVEVPVAVVQLAFIHLAAADSLGLSVATRDILKLITKGKTMTTKTSTDKPTKNVAPAAAQSKPTPKPAGAPKAAGKPAAAAKTAAVASKPAAAAKPAAKPSVVPSKQVAASAAKEAAKNAPKAGLAKTGVKAAAAAAEAPKKGGKPSEADDTKYKVADDSSVKRGFIREFVDEAKKMKVFKREPLVEKFIGKTERQDRTWVMSYWYWCTSKGIFAPA
jgi:hypothetical protein